MLKQILIVFLLFGIVGIGLAQNKSLTPEDHKSLMKQEADLGMLAYLIINDSMDISRFTAVKAFIPQLVTALKTKNSFRYPFTQLQSYISILYPPDSTFRIITWQVQGEGDFQNFGAIQMNEEDLKLYPLIDRSETYPDVEDKILKPTEWFGAIYYRLMPLTKKKNNAKYVLFGFDNFNPLTRRKVLDILSFDSDGKPIFGAPVFKYEDGSVKNRMVMEYYSGATTTLNYDVERKKIIYDHLISHNDKDGNVLRVSDGSYEGFVFKKGKLKHIDKVFHLKVEEPPMPFPVLQEQKGKDVIGRQKANKS